MSEECAKEIKYWSKNDLKNLVKIVLKGNIEEIEARTRPEIINNIMTLYENDDKLKNFFELLTKLDKISINKARNCLTESFRIPVDETRKIKKRSTLILTLYTHDLIKKIEYIRFISNIDRYKHEWGYNLNLKQRKNLSETISLSLEEFYKEWNQNNTDPVFADLVPTKEDLFLIRIAKEIGRRIQNQFIFRSRNKNLDEWLTPAEFKTTRLENYPISYKNIYIQEEKNNLFKLIFNFNIKKERKMVEHLLLKIFGLEIKLEQLEFSKSDIFKTIENNTKELFNNFKSKEFDNINDEFNKMKKISIAKLEELDTSTEKKMKLREIIKKTYLLPPKIFGVTEKGIIKIDLDVEPEDFLKDPKGKQISKAFYEIAGEVGEDRKTYIYSINGKRIELHPEKMNKTFKKLGELEQLALKLILGDNIDET